MWVQRSAAWTDRGPLMPSWDGFGGSSVDRCGGWVAKNEPEKRARRVLAELGQPFGTAMFILAEES